MIEMASGIPTVGDTTLFGRMRAIIRKYVESTNLAANDLYIKTYIAWLGVDEVQWCLALDDAELEEIVLEDLHWFIMPDADTIPDLSIYDDASNTIKAHRTARQNSAELEIHRQV